MNEKPGYLNVFFKQQSNPLTTFRAEDLIEWLPDMIFIYDAESRRVQYGNRKFKDFTGRFSHNHKPSDEELKTLLHPEDSRYVEKLLNSSRYQNESVMGSYSVRMPDRNGHYRFHELQANAVTKDDKGRAQLILFVAKDISDQLKSKKEIETTRELLDETEELLQFGSWAWDITTNTVSWTSGLYALLGYTRQEVAGRIGFDFYSDHLLEEYSQAFKETIQNALKEKKDFTQEYVIKTKSGELKNISTKGRLVRDENGEVVKVLCVNRDITALRSFEKEQERNIRELNRSNKDLEEFAYIASHDLQEPLRKISMFTERLKAKYDQTLDEEGELFIERILVSAANMRTLIDNLLDFSRANRRSHSFDTVDIKSILDGVVSELELKIEETKARITFSGNFPTVEAVTSEMKQLFSNILSNAIKFRKDQVLTEIRVHAGKLSKNEKQTMGLPMDNIFHRIEVQDNGIGFDPEYAEKIFQIFQRLNGKSEYPGSGIGLAICK
ncbi:MAG TPA: PAS domain-containing protein, partial [Chryseosolibacter sp.]|nr:PAS domain-containing protein [Chryseosolibacter sp.]